MKMHMGLSLWDVSVASWVLSAFRIASVQCKKKRDACTGLRIIPAHKTVTERPKTNFEPAWVSRLCIVIIILFHFLIYCSYLCLLDFILVMNIIFLSQKK